MSSSKELGRYFSTHGRLSFTSTTPFEELDALVPEPELVAWSLSTSIIEDFVVSMQNDYVIKVSVFTF
jgi:hypothetical protein